TIPADTGATDDKGYTNWFEVDYQDVFVAEGDVLLFSRDQVGTWTYTVAGFTTNDVVVYDVTDPANIVQIIGLNVVPGGSFDATFQDTTAGVTDYAAAASAGLLSVSSIELDTPSDLKNPANGADWIAITPAEFRAQAEVLAAHRASFNGYRTAVVDVQDIYDEFNSGKIDAEAIRTFLAYAYANWTPPAPQFVVLFGDGHYDFKNHLGSSDQVWIPPYLAAVDPFMGETAADNRYVAPDPPPGQSPLPFMALGRFPVNSVAEAQAVVSKTIVYETSPTPGTWNQDVVFVADDADNAGDFPEHSDGVAEGLVAASHYSVGATEDNEFTMTLDLYAAGVNRPEWVNQLKVRFLVARATTDPLADTDFVELCVTTAGSGTTCVTPSGGSDTTDGAFDPTNVAADDGIRDPMTVSNTQRDESLYQEYTFPQPLVAPGDTVLGLTLTHNFLERGLSDAELKVYVPAGWLPNTFNREKIYYRVNYTSVSAVTTALVNAINSGALFVNYHGHASIQNWAGERIFEISDLSSLSNEGHYPIMMPMTCLEGHYISPGFPSLGEAVVRLTNAGAVASWSPTGLGVATGHETIYQGFYDAVFNQGISQLGLATNYAKEALFYSTSPFKDLIDAYVLFGDPALTIHLPAPDVAISKSSQPSSPWLPGEAITYTLTYTNQGSQIATGVVITDLIPSELINPAWSASGMTATVRGGTTFVWDVADLAPGDGGVISITATVDPSITGGGIVTNTALIATTSNDGNPSNNSSSTSDPISSGLVRLGGITWNDRNANGARDGFETDIVSGVPITVTTTGGTVITTTVTDANGEYLVENLSPGTYTVTAGSVSGFIITTPATRTVTLQPGEEALDLDFGYIAPTAVELLAFQARWEGSGVRLTWRTGREENVVGFHIYRSSAPSPPGKRLTFEPIPATAGPSGGAIYSFWDGGVSSGTYYYWLETVELGGSERFGPVSVADVPEPGSGSLRLYLPTVTANGG
ncbi:MAG TPA: DUF11 domain-containing protein, partial [Anaerolineae bacterium]|nr:DUF11 domain-containing protein [Anaerolineae bacterium]